jgi:hypothetical protein
VADLEGGVPCRSYTHARRYPWVIGKVGGWQLPTQLSPAQLAALGTTLFVLVRTRTLWAHLPPMLNLLVEIALPAGSAWAVRHLRMEGRTPLRALCGLATYLATPRLGRLQGRPYRDPPARPVTGRLFVTPCPPAASHRPGMLRGAGHGARHGPERGPELGAGR